MSVINGTPGAKLSNVVEIFKELFDEMNEATIIQHLERDTK